MNAIDDRTRGYLDEFERWLPGPRAEQLRAELETHLREADARGNLVQALERLGTPRQAALDFGRESRLVPASLLDRAWALAIDVLVTIVAADLAVRIAMRTDCFGTGCEDRWTLWQYEVRWTLTFILFGGVLTLMEWRLGRTPGKDAMRLRVVSQSGLKPTLWQAIVRRLPLVLGGPLVAVDAAFALRDERRQRGFDRLAETIVVDARETWSPLREDERAARDARRRRWAMGSGLTAAVLMIGAVGLWGWAGWLAWPVAALLGYISLRLGLEVARPRDRWLLGCMVAGVMAGWGWVLLALSAELFRVLS